MTSRNWLILKANLIRMSWIVGLSFWAVVAVLAMIQPDRGAHDEWLCKQPTSLLALCD